MSLQGLWKVTWPIFANQFHSEKLVTQVLRIGVPIGNEDWKMCPTEETSLISRDKIHKAVSHVMDGGNEVEGMRSVVKRLGELAKEAIENGGSSYIDLKTLMEDIKLHRQK